MDSDDEFMSGVSSQEEDFGGTQQSDDDSLGDGKCREPFLESLGEPTEANSQHRV